METTTLVAPDISCEHCQHAIEEALGELAGVNTIKVDIPTKTTHSFTRNRTHGSDFSLFSSHT